MVGAVAVDGVVPVTRGAPLVGATPAVGAARPMRTAPWVGTVLRVGAASLLAMVLLVGARRVSLAADLRSTPQARRVEAVALYDGSDRLQRLVEGARREDKLTIYTSMSTQVLNQVVDSFRRWLEQKHGLKPQVVVWRGGSEDVLQRAVLEARAGRHEVDVIESNGNELEILKREGVTGRFRSPLFSDYPADLRDPAGYWHATRLNIFTQAYNTNLVRRTELPKTWSDLLEPRWRGRMAIEATDWDWFATLVTRGPFGSQEQALAFFDRLRQQDLQVRQGHTLLAELLAAGEVALVLTEYNYITQSFKVERKAPVDWFVLEPAVARPNGLAVAANAPHPYLAMLFVDFMLSPDGQAILNQFNIAPASPKVSSPLTQGFRYILADTDAVIDHAQMWQQRWEERVIRK